MIILAKYAYNVNMVYKTMKIYITKYSEIIKPVLVQEREGALWAHSVGGDTGAGSSRQMDYVTTCGLVPSSVRSYHWVQPLASSSDARPTNTLPRSPLSLDRKPPLFFTATSSVLLRTSGSETLKSKLWSNTGFSVFFDTCVFLLPDLLLSGNKYMRT